MRVHSRLWLFALAIGCSASALAGDLRLTVHVFDYARLPVRTLESSIVEAKRLLGDAGADLLWTSCAPPAKRGECHISDDGSYLIVRIIPRSDPKGSVAFGKSVKPLDPNEPGVYVTLYYTRIESASRRVGTGAQILLGCAMAHEIGEMLGLTHSVGGIMHAAYDEDDIQRAARGGLAFTSSQAIELQKALLRRLGDGGAEIFTVQQ